MNDPSDLELMDRVLRCWGKTDPQSTDPQQFHPALFHMLDIGNVAMELLCSEVSNRWKNVFSSLYSVDHAVLKGFIPFIVALHDIGKISSCFQRQNDLQRSRLITEGFTFGGSTDIPHSEVSRNFINYELSTQEGFCITEKSKQVIREMASGHHGRFSSPGTLAEIRTRLMHEEPPKWRELRICTYRLLKEIFLEQSFTTLPEPIDISAAVMQLTGFTILCDWIGSDHQFFQQCPDILIENYQILSRDRASLAVSSDGFSISVTSGASSDFHNLFPMFSPPRPLQLAIDDIPDDLLLKPTLTVIEAPTGEGKTEASLALAHRIGRLRDTDEFYYALPTTATSNQMYLRVQKYLHGNLSLGVDAKLIHGQAFLIQDLINTQPLSNGGKEPNDLENVDWFNTKKRALLAPFGVGTIDQIELGALNVKHASLRLAGLAGKVVILDEVHAYDTYMTTIIVRLLSWLKSLETSVILLSATLPSSRRRILLQTFYQEPAGESENVVYPLISIGNSSETKQFKPDAYQKSHDLNIDFLHFTEGQAEEKARWLINQVASGGCACFITNTVDRAQEIYSHVKALAPKEIKKVLFHARFPLSQRREIETRIMNLVGPEKENRQRSAIVIGTQVLEQSLDLDFDVMVTDIAPVDLLLQRSGRLHRHANTNRPSGLKTPKMFINVPLNDQMEPIMKIDGYVYSEYFLLRTYEILKDRKVIHLPEDFRSLVEAVYEEMPCAMEGELKRAYLKLLEAEEFARQEAELRLLPGPDPDELFTGSAARMTFVESETEASWTVAQTRLGEQSVNVIPLEDMGDYYMLPGGSEKLPKKLAASREIETALLQVQIRVSQVDIVKALRMMKDEIPEVFTGSPVLRNYYPIWMKEGIAEIHTKKGEYTLRLDPELGLLIDKKGG